MKETIKKVCMVLLFTLLSLSGYAQASGEKTITGTVRDNAGLGIPGVNVTEKGTKNAVATDFDGQYTIKVKNGAVLTFAYIGMVKMEKSIGNGGSVDVVMKEDASELKEVVVVGYGAQKKDNLTSAVATVKMDEIQDLPTGDIATALAGRVLGVIVSGGSTRPGEKATIVIRNPATFAKDASNLSPLYVIDGVLQVDAKGNNDSTIFDNLDASEVESISFLKDASAAIYGARSAQGVVLVTTKRGKKGASKFSYSGTYGVSDQIYQTKVLNAYEFGKYVNIMNGPNGYARTAGDNQYFFSDKELEYFKTIDYNALEEEFSPSYTMRHNLNVSGGSDKATYFAGISYYKQNGNLGTLDYDKWTFRAGSDINITENLKAGLQVSGFYSEQASTFSKYVQENVENDYNYLLLRVPYVPLYVNGLPAVMDGTNNNNLQYYHFGEIQKLGNVTGDTDNTTTVNLYTEYKIPFIKGLMARASYARNMGHSRATQVGTFYSLTRFKGAGTDIHLLDENSIAVGTVNIKNGDRMLFDNTTNLSEQYNINVSYNRDFGKHSVSGLFAIEKSEAESHFERVYKDNVQISNNGQFNTATGALGADTAHSEGGSLSYIGRANYAYDDKYLAEFLYRTDASTKFAPENYWGNFYSLSTGWVVSKENFFKSKVIDFLKFRYSVGLLGKDDTQPWQWKQRYAYAQFKGAVFGGNSNPSDAIIMDKSPNPDATWSDELKTNFGIESKFLNNRLSFGMEAYYNFGTNVLMNVTGNVPFTIGGSVAAQNYGSVDQFGYEFELGWSDKIGNDITYGVDMRFGWSDDKVIKANFNAEDILLPWNVKPGERSDNGVWGLDYMGMFKTQADIDAYVSQYKITTMNKIPVAQLRPGMLYYRDVRGAYLGNGQFAAPDGIINENDRVQLSKRASNQYGLGTTLKFAYKSFSINAVLNASFGDGWADISSNARKGMKSQINQIAENLPKIWNDVYDPVLNPNGTMPASGPSNDGVDSNAQQSKFWEVNSFRLSCRNINVAYALPGKVLSALNISSCKLNLTALNPFILYNPYSFQEPGGYRDYPTLRTISLGLNVGF